MKIDINDILDMTELPWPEVKLPDFMEGTFGEWRLEGFNVPLLRGYWRGLRPIPHQSYRLFKGNKIWMSTTPMELESQQHAIHEFSGHVVIAGGGLGITAYNAALKESVTTVTVIEIDPQVIDFVERQADENCWPHWNKVRWINRDIRKMYDFSSTQVDFLWVDIWERLGEERALKDVMKLQKKIKANVVGYWGMELDFVSYLHGKNWGGAGTVGDWIDFQKMTGLPIMIADGQAERAHAVAKNICLI